MLVAVVAFAACEMDLYRSDTMTSANFKTNPGAAVYSTDGNYAMLKDEVTFNMTDRGGFARIYFLMSELRGDNASLSNHTSDPLCKNAIYQDIPTDEDLSYMWYICYKIIYGCNTNIEAMPEGEGTDTDHLIGENYFLRAYCHFSLCNLFATPYSRGADKPGVIIRNSTDFSVTERATVGQVYKQIEEDLLDAMRLMKDGQPRGNKGYASYDAARGLLTRLYLYMGRNDECRDLCNDMLGDAPAANLDDISGYFANAKESKETIWCIGRTTTDASYSPQGMIGSMFYTAVEGDGSTGDVGWCEVYWSDPLIELMSRHPEDKRFTEYFYQFGRTNDGLKMMTWPIVEDNEFHLNNGKLRNIKGFDPDATENNIIVVADDGTDKPAGVTVYRKDVNGQFVYYRTDLYTDEEDKDDVIGGTRVYLRDNASLTLGFRKGQQPMYGMTKYSFQDGHTLLSSPVVIRWAEIVLNRAEAKAKLGDIAGALADVNVIRRRAGIPTLDAVPAGYTDILDVVLDERRMELCFEGHRAIDVYRNGRDLDRRYGGYQDYEIITPADMDVRYPYCIPFGEISITNIPGNGRQ